MIYLFVTHSCDFGNNNMYAKILYLIKDQLIKEEDQPISFKFICALLK